MMNEEIIEKVAQLQHQNIKLLDELNHLKEHTFSLEESLNLKCFELLEEKKRIKSIEQQCSSLVQLITDKDNLIESLENEKSNLTHLSEKLSSENLILKEELLQEKSKSKYLEVLKTKEEDFKILYSKVKEDNKRLISELSLKTDECASNAAAVKDMQFQIKELENEKAELIAMRDALLIREKDERLRTSESLECFLRKSPEWSKSQMNIFVQGEQELSSTPLDRETININLREEILEVELQEKQKKILQLESLLRKKEEDDFEKNVFLANFKEELKNAGLLNYDTVIDLKLDIKAFRNFYHRFLKIINWPEGQSGECKPLTDAGALTVVVKDGVQTTQPNSVRVVETISIASQTDPLKNLSPVLPLRTFEKSQSNLDLNLSRSDSDDNGEESLSFMEKDKVQKGLQLFAEPKNCDLDMDMYRSCRKLSVLPEEDVEETHIRKSSLKKSCTSRLSICNSKTQSADDVTNIQIIKPTIRATSCFNITLKNCMPEPTSEPFQEKHFLSNVGDGEKESCVTQNLKADDKLQVSFISAKEAFRQPHSFESYLDPLKIPSSPLPRQTSDPTSNAIFAPSVIRRGSYIRRPRSTCRPLTLPCDKTERKKEERVCKVRFDLPGNVPKSDDNIKDEQFHCVLSNSDKIKMVSRFKVEIIDEVEFRKSLEENSKNKGSSRKRPPLIHPVTHKKSALRDLTNINENIEAARKEVQNLNNIPKESPGSPVYDTATENSSVGSFDMEENECFSDLYPLKRRRQSDISCSSLEDSPDSSGDNDIYIKSIKLHTNSECIIMKELKKENSDSSRSNPDSEIPYIDAEDLPVVKPSPDIVKVSPVAEILFPEKQVPSVAVLSPGSASEGSEAYFTPCDVTPVSDNNGAFGCSKSSGLSKSPTVLKNLANFELLASIRESRKLFHNETIEEEAREDQCVDQDNEVSEDRKSSEELISAIKVESSKRASSDVSEASESDTLTFGTVRSHVAVSSDADSDTYVTVWSDKSFSLERKFSDLSENSSSPYNTPPDTSSASFCTPPDTYSPVLNSTKKHYGVMMDKSHINYDSNDSKNQEEYPESFSSMFDVTASSPPVHHTAKFLQNNGFPISKKEADESSKLPDVNKGKNYNDTFDLPKLEFYETNDSVENLEAFLQTEEGLKECKSQLKKPYDEKANEIKGLRDLTLFGAEELKNNLENPKLLERRNKKHPPLSRQNSTEEYIFLDPHDSCLNLSEEISSPSTTPDTSNKTVIFKNVPLTVSNTIDLDDDFPISETEMHINFNSSQTEILKIPLKERSFLQHTKDGHCLSEPCTPSISCADFLEFSIPRKPRSSFTEESLMRGLYEANLPEIVVSRLSSESENSDADILCAAETDFASNVSDRSEIHLSDVISISGHSDNSNSLSEHSDNLNSDVYSSDSEKSSGVSPEVTQNSSSLASEKTVPKENSVQEECLPAVICDDFQ